MMYQFLNKVRKEGLLSVEMDVEKPTESAIFKNYPEFLDDHHARDFVCDTLRMAITGGVEPFDMDQMMELDMEVHHHEASQPVAALTTVADALPGLGIVAAVLGVVITMGALGGPPEEIGHKVAAALVGTFLGILLCYGVAGPLSSNMAKTAEAHDEYLHVLRVLLLVVPEGLGADDRHRNGAARHSRACAAHLRRDGEALQGQQRRAGGRGLRPSTRQRERSVMTAKRSTHHRHQEEERARRPPRRRLEGGLRRFCHRHDGAVHRALADELQRTRLRRPWPDTSTTQREPPSLLGTTMSGNGVAVRATAKENLNKLKEKLEEEIKAKKELEKLSKQIEMTITPGGAAHRAAGRQEWHLLRQGSARLSESGQQLLALLARN